VGCARIVGKSDQWTAHQPQLRFVAGVEAGIPSQNANPPIDIITRNRYPLPAFDKAFLQLDSFHAGN
jgi:hypothetical protein